MLSIEILANNASELTPSENVYQRWHWRKRQKAAERWRNMVWAWIHINSYVRLEPPEQKMKATITSYRAKLCDEDNLNMKALIDALKKNLLIRDDSPNWLVLEVKQEKCKRAEQKTVIELEEAWA